MNVAALMQQTAQPGTVQVAEPTYHLTESLFEFEALGEITVTGRAAPVRAYRVLGRKAGRGSAAAPGQTMADDAEGFLAPTVDADSLGDPALEHRVESLIRMRPPKLDVAQPPRGAVGEHSFFSVLLCDVAGSTALAEQLELEVWAELINAAFEHMISSVFRYDGMVNRFLHDGIEAYFGIPIAQEEIARRAILTGLKIVEALRPLRERIQRDRDVDFNVRVGISTVPAEGVAPGTVLRPDFTTMQEAIAVAKHMKRSAQAGTVQITAQTQKLATPWFEFESRDEIEAIGLGEPVPAYRVLGRKQE